MRKLVALVAAVAALAVAGVASAGTPVQSDCPRQAPVVDCKQITVGNDGVASVTVKAAPELSPTTAFAIGVWSSLPVATQVTVSYSINCAHNINDVSGSTVLTAGSTVSTATYLWFGSKTVAGPWYGWDVCSASVTFSQPGGQGVDHSLVGWLASHNGA
jgi:hypothetical protein